MTRKSKITLAGITLLLSGSAAIFMLTPLWDKDAVPLVNDMLTAPRTEQQLRLYAAESGKLGVQPPPWDTSVDYFVKPQFLEEASSHITKKDGTVEDDQYRPGTRGSVMFSQDYYRRLVNEKLPRLRGAAMFEPDGVTYKKHVVRRPNGTVERIGQRLRDGRYEERYMFDDPNHLERSTVARLRYFDQALHFVQDTIYAWKADKTETYVSAKIIQADSLGQYYVSLYRENGSLSATMKFGTGSEEGTLFDEDGSHVLAEWGRDMTSLAFYKVYQSGSDNPIQVWQSVMGRTTVTVLDPNTQAIKFQQVWQERPDPANIGSKILLLMKVAADFRENNPQLLIEMVGDGSRPAEVIERNSNGKQKSRSANVAAKTIEPDLLKLPRRPVTPVFANFGPERVYDYF
jgi:hypothetical protein